MMSVLDVITAVMVTAGAFFALTGAVGVLRFPDFFTRLHPAGKTDTLGALLILGGLALQALEASDAQAAVKLLLITTFLFVTAPTAAHAIGKAAHLDGVKPWLPGEAGENSDAAASEPATAMYANARGRADSSASSSSSTEASDPRGKSGDGAGGAATSGGPAHG